MECRNKGFALDAVMSDCEGMNMKHLIRPLHACALACVSDHVSQAFTFHSVKNRASFFRLPMYRWTIPDMKLLDSEATNWQTVESKSGMNDKIS